MHLRHQHPEPACDFQQPRLDQLGHPILGSVSRLIRAADTAIRRGFSKIARERMRRASIQELQGMSDRQLLDIGVERSEITATVERILEQKAHRGDA
ncbi:DUF1127 domain-containing protein [Nisaea denitrificans]|uniref:DUF1127 domain-containing protein n=1 Tax=Nisaea denitrificans TaxID=390877 RepID=UPI000491A4DD|nr:DUF1127 domain-containing protein [Nisaea denitrificans]